MFKRKYRNFQLWLIYGRNWKLRYFCSNKKVPQFHFRFWIYSWVVNKNHIKTFLCEDGNNLHSAKHEINNLTWFTRKNCWISKLFAVVNKHWPRPYWNTLEHISAHHIFGALAPMSRGYNSLIWGLKPHLAPEDLVFVIGSKLMWPVRNLDR